MGEPTCFTLKIRYGGILQHTPRRQYIGGSVEYFDFVDSDKCGLLDIWGYAEELGYNDHSTLRFWIKTGKNFDKQHKVLETDVDVCNLGKNVPQNWEVEMFIEHFNLEGEGQGMNPVIMMNQVKMMMCFMNLTLIWRMMTNCLKLTWILILNFVV